MPQWGDDSLESIRVAGYGLADSWFDVERGDEPLSPEGIADVDEMVIAVTDADGEDHYYTVYGGFDEWQDFLDYVEVEILETYGDEAA